MTSGPRQLAFRWPNPESYAREDFVAAPENLEALRRIEAWPGWPNPTLMLIGPEGSGKTHLGEIWARASGAQIVGGGALAGADLVALAGGPVLVDDADTVDGAEAELFHLINLIRERGVSALLTARRPPDAWGLGTADLLSRLRLAPTVELLAPGDDFLRAVLLKQFSDRQLAVDAATVNYIALRIERSLEAARTIVDTLDREALAQGRSVTRALAAEVLRDEAQ